LYFIQSFKSLSDLTKLPELQLKAELLVLINKGWVKCFLDNENEVFDDLDLENKYREYSYLVTKAGLMVHNNRM
jgi:hypothetical protein